MASRVADKQKRSPLAPRLPAGTGAGATSNPFLNAPTLSRSLLPAGLAPWHIFALCVVVGLVIVGWRAKRRNDDAHARAQTTALAHATALEQQLNQAVSAAELLGALARQAGGRVPDFQKVAAGIAATRPAVDMLELQPGGVISDIVPRSGNERALGFNVLNHQTYGPGARFAIQKHGLTVQGPIALYRWEMGIIVRDPLFFRGRDGRDAFWGFVTASTKFSDAVRHARLDELYRQGYAYRLYAPANRERKAVTVASHGTMSVENAEQQPVRAGDLELQLALRPRGGWLSKTRLILECLAVLAGSGLIGLLLAAWESRSTAEAQLTVTADRLTEELEARKKAQDECRTAVDEARALRAELAKTRESLQTSTEQEVRLNAAVRAAEAAAQAGHAELEQARAAQQQAEQLIRSLQARLADAAQAEKDAAAEYRSRIAAAQAAAANLQARLDAASTQPPPTAEPIAPQPEAPSPAAPEPTDIAPSPGPSPSDAPAESADPSEELVEPQAPPPIPDLPEEPSAAPAPQPPPAPAESKPTRAPRRKKPRPDLQMDLFGAQSPQADSPARAESAPAPKDNAESRPSTTEEPPAPPPPRPAESESAPKASADARSTDSKPEPEPKEPRKPRRLPAPPPLNPSAFRKAANQILPLFTGEDPGAWDCLKANRDAFRSAFDPEAYVEFEQTVKKRNFAAALEDLKKAARRHGLSL